MDSPDNSQSNKLNSDVQYGVGSVPYHTHNGVDSPTLSPTSGQVTSVSGSGPGISISPTTGNVVAQNTGVTSLASSGATTSAPTGAVTITVSDATLNTSDITTNNVSVTKHGFAPKAPNDATKYLDGTGAYSVPGSGSSGFLLLSDQAITAGSSPFTSSSFSAVSYLRIVVLLQNQAVSNGLYFQFNGDTGNNYSWVYTTTGSGGPTGNATSDANIRGSDGIAGAGGPQIYTMDILNYSGSLKSVRGWSSMSRTNVTSLSAKADFQGTWNNTSAQITTITLTNGGGTTNFTSGDRLLVYGN